MDQMQLAKALLREGKVEEAVELYISLWDHMLEKEPAMFGVRHSFFLNDLKRLLAQAPEAQAPFLERWLILHARVEAGDNDLLRLSDWLTLSKLVQKEGAALAFAIQPDNRSQLSCIERFLYHLLVVREQWTHAGWMLTDPIIEAREIIDSERRGVPDLDLPNLPEDAFRETLHYLTARRKSRSGSELLNLYRACLAATRSEVVALKQLILEREDSAQTRAALKEIDGL